MKNQFLLKSLLLLQTAAIAGYTLVAFTKEGADLFSVFLSNLSSFTWNGQFNLDFGCYLMLSGLWIMWRDRFSSKAIIVAVAAMILGIIFFAPYLLYLLRVNGGNWRMVFLGRQSA